MLHTRDMFYPPSDYLIEVRRSMERQEEQRHLENLFRLTIASQNDEIAVATKRQADALELLATLTALLVKGKLDD